ncbi:PHB accumulation regulatory domain-containing protein [Endozoicomonas atrinae]|uniref:PHB accumulation regulatory domain-containing protein n=1 Tax=Endozoicomonas atrinae TaxID=1333660 RepID=UPI003B004075
MLKQLIRFYGDDMQVFLRQYLEQSLNHFLKQQDTMQGLLKNMIDAGPIGMISKIMEQNLDTWQKFTHQDSDNEEK